MSKEEKPKLYSDNRWNCIPACDVVGHVNITFENELNGLNEMMKTELFDEEWYQKELKIIKERYGVKD